MILIRAVKLEVYDLTGQKIKKTLLNGHKDKGKHKVSWNGFTDSGIKATSGIYFLHFVFNNRQQIKKEFY
jgi:flagellar hook assembly protein FlgD